MGSRITGQTQELPPSTPAVAAVPSAPLPTTRRPRVREVSSRFMSPVSSSRSSSSSSSAGDIHLLPASSPRNDHHQTMQRSVSAQRQRRQLKMGELDENNRPAETARSLDSPFPSVHSHGHSVGGIHTKINVKPLKENGHRIDTPTPLVAPPPSRSRLSHHRSLSSSAAAKLLQSSVMSLSSTQPSNDREKPKESTSVANSSDRLPTISNRNHSSKIFNNSMASTLSRSFSSPLSSCDDSSLIRSVKGNEKVSSYLKNTAGLSLPPMPPNVKLPADPKKAKKVVGHQEDVHSLKLMHNHYLQWRFANAMAEVRMQSQRTQAEKMLYALGLKISELYNSVQRKRIELQQLMRVENLTTVLESQIPYLEDWSTVEADYSASLSEATQALLNASQRLPLGANVRVDAKELGEALASATKLMEGIAFHIGSYMPKAEEVEILMSELARVTGGERALIEECGVLLSKKRASQIEECSLRGQLIQFHHKNSICKLQEAEN